MKSFVIEYHRKTGELRIREFQDSDLAISDRINKYRNRESSDVEVVSIQADSLETLRRTHSRYFFRHEPDYAVVGAATDEPETLSDIERVRISGNTESLLGEARGRY